MYIFNIIKIKFLIPSSFTFKVNTTYQFLCGKLNELSKYLYDERIKSKLKKEITILHEIQKSNNTKYPFERAEKLNSSMRKLSLNTNQNYIDQFRILVTHIGKIILINC